MNGSYRFWEQRQRRQSMLSLQRRRRVDTLPLDPSLGQLTAELLNEVLEDRRAQGERAPGPDGVWISEISRSEGWDICRHLAGRIRTGKFKPSESREVQLSKPDGGYRTIRIHSLAFGIVAGAIHTILQPKLESIYLPTSYGFRHERNRWHMLLALEHGATQQNRWHVTQNDVRQAFDNIPLVPAKEAFRRHITNKRLLKLIHTLLDGHAEEHREKGIAQGSPLGTDTWNLFAHENLDIPLHREIQPSIHRFADNLATGTTDEPEGLARMAEVANLLHQFGMQLKYESRATDIRKEPVEILGVQMRYLNGKVRYTATPTSWQDLEEALQLTWGKPNPRNQAEHLLRGWTESHAATFGDRSESTDLIYKAALEAGHHDIPRESVRKMVQSSQNRWQHFYGTEMAKLQSGEDRTGEEELSGHESVHAGAPHRDLAI